MTFRRVRAAVSRFFKGYSRFATGDGSLPLTQVNASSLRPGHVAHP